jgi:signal transduction histidine kinase
MARSLVADLSGRTAEAISTTTTRRVPAPAAPRAAAIPLWIDQLEAAFLHFDGHPDTAAAFGAAGKRARALAEAAQGDDQALRSAALGFAADALTAIIVERACSHETAKEMVATTAGILGVSQAAVSVELFVRAVSNPRLLELPPLLTVELQLRLLLALAPTSDVSLWAEGPAERLRCLAHLGNCAPTRRVRHVARSVLSGAEDGGNERGTIHGLPVMRWQQPYAVLVARARPEDRRRALAFLEEAAALLAPVLEREMLLERNSARERGQVEARERRLVRLGFDLHDGPMQDLVALAADVRLAQAEIGEHVNGRARDLVVGRLEDLNAQIVDLDAKLRDLVRSLEPSRVTERPLPEVLRREVETFEARTQIATGLELTGNLQRLTASQRIALYRIVQEGLSNIRKHSEATTVQVTVHGGDHSLDARIVDDGKGFPVTPTLIRAAKGGRLGLVGIGERIRLLGGRFDVDSRPGGGTTLSLKLPRWQPPAVETGS